MMVIENEFEDKRYVREFSFHRFSLDFAWPHLKRCIEIDGDQHSKPEYQARDHRKDELLKAEGWQILRIKWRDMYSDSKTFIALAKSFVQEASR